jgi:uncharacterized repeat protein (TIGR03843 family)
MIENVDQVEATTLTAEAVLHLLSEGDVEVEGLIPWSSNATFLVTVRSGELSTLAVYKPQQGERPLWDFEHGSLGQREVAAYRLCQALGWRFVPPTVLRTGPYGLGSVQLFIHARDDAHFFTIEDDPAFRAALKRLAAFDVVANNADRKSGHCLVDAQGRLWAIDNALTFHEEPKLRTVNWSFAGAPLPAAIRRDLARLEDDLVAGAPLACALADLLAPAELDALHRRARRLRRANRFPQPGSGRAVPWPLV